MEIPVAPDEEAGQAPRVRSKSTLFVVAGFFFILFSIGGGGGIGVFTQFYSANSVILRNFWRFQVTLAYLIPVIAIELYFFRPKWRELTMRDALILLIICPFAFIGWSTCIIFVSRVTLLLHAIVLNNLCGPFILAANLIFRLPIHRLEWQGCIVALMGAAAMMFDPAAEKADGSKASITGDLLALIGAACGALLYFFQGQPRAKVPLATSIAISVFMVLIYFTIAFAFIPEVEFSMDPESGVFGWMDPGQLELTVGLGLFSNFFGTAGILISMYFVSPVLMSNIMLLEPISAQILGCVAGLDKVPGVVSFVGAAVAILGLYIIGRGSGIKERELAQNPK